MRCLVILIVILRATSALAEPAMIELLHSVPSTITLSSTVDNPTIKPEHLVDRDLGTAWNSRTGDLIGAWIEIELPKDVVAKELRLTVGNTGKGSKGEDYFPMNVRVKGVYLSAKNFSKSVLYDITRRDRQTVVLPDLTGGGKLRIQIDAIEMGTKKTWREICISELEVWGTAPAAAIGKATPKLVVDPTLVANTLCDEFDAEQKEYAKGQKRRDQEPTGNVAGPPVCDVRVAPMFQPTGKWQHVGVRCHSTDSHYAEFDCPLIVETKGWWFGPPVGGRHVEVVDAAVRDVIPGGDPELVVSTGDLLVVCSTDRKCTTPFTLSRDGWEVTPTFANGKLVLTAKDGKPPADAIGTFPLVLQ